MTPLKGTGVAAFRLARHLCRVRAAVERKSLRAEA
jgi:hypothetical protein